MAHGSLTVTVTATGNLEPTNQVDVGSEVSGLVEAVFVDDNDRVTVNQVLARLDISKLEDAVVNNRAALASAEARVLQATASVTEARANLTRLQRVAELSGGKVPSQAELETAEASLARAEADEASARATVEQARASLSSAETSLAKASIRSPINGVVLARQVEPGQTVAASFQAPVLFTLAEDLSSMELEVDVDEADVGQVRAGQKAVFTVDAYPNRQFPATIVRVDFGSQVTDGVVSYATVLRVDNDDLRLRPGHDRHRRHHHRRAHRRSACRERCVVVRASSSAHRSPGEARTGVEPGPQTPGPKRRLPGHQGQPGL